MKVNKKKLFSTLSVLLSVVFSSQVFSAVSLDRTRIIFNGDRKNVALTITNKNVQLPFLAQGWMEDSEGKKITNPFIVLPPVQRLEPGKTSQVRIESLPDVDKLPQDRESVFYFNLREIPPKSDKPNVLQLALQSKIKLFYRPTGILMSDTEMNANPWQNKLILIKKGNQYVAKNPTAFNTTLVAAASSETAQPFNDFSATMVPPFGEMALNLPVSKLGNAPVLTYINDYGGRLKLPFKCQSDQCVVVPSKKS
ncbi:fimbria/pilus periplasmic chaperone [uncultured Cedecea sp.]|uniref:fimbria/pilus periplasmic chaperone n=1 Tax=uncultured Cedecea sp. TaxID=988762 RepID=UPI0026351D91|nr:fimbria/pilus periplasmic chaperone [uncultured Cedecea sp.]